MPRRRELQAVASGLLGSFVSRNNDVGGYWAIGKLYRHALENALLSVAIDLTAKTLVPPEAEFAVMVSRYVELLRRQCTARRVPADWVVDARLQIQFEVAPDAPVEPSHDASEKPFTCLVEIKDDLGRMHAAYHRGWCAPHDPARERRSVRG